MYTVAGAVDASGTLPDGRRFHDIRELKAIVAADPRQLARNFLRQLTIYATGTPVRFSDRPEIEKMLDSCAKDDYRARDLVHALVRSRVFLENRSDESSSYCRKSIASPFVPARGGGNAGAADADSHA